jgi:hypothetical protein
MKQSINFNQFHDAFRDHNRLDNFTYDGLKALFEWIEELDDSCGTDTELDVIALCCEFSEYDSALDCIKDTGYNFTPEPFECSECLTVTYSNGRQCEEEDCKHLATEEEHETWEEDQEGGALEYLHDHTMVITFNSGIIIQDF